MNKKIKCLIDGGFISTNDVMEYAGYLENQMNQYYEQYAEEQSRLLDEEERMLEDLYGQDEPEEDYPFDLGSQRSDDPEYIIASTSYKMEETYIFEANQEGKITNSAEYGGLCKRHGDHDWMNRDLTVQSVFPDKYQHVKNLDPKGENVYHSLYKKITNEKN